jgi:hypothetical protein
MTRNDRDDLLEHYPVHIENSLTYIMEVDPTLSIKKLKEGCQLVGTIFALFAEDAPASCHSACQKTYVYYAEFLSTDYKAAAPFVYQKLAPPVNRPIHRFLELEPWTSLVLAWNIPSITNAERLHVLCKPHLSKFIHRFSNNATMPVMLHCMIDIWLGTRNPITATSYACFLAEVYDICTADHSLSYLYTLYRIKPPVATPSRAQVKDWVQRCFRGQNSS